MRNWFSLLVLCAITTGCGGGTAAPQPAAAGGQAGANPVQPVQAGNAGNALPSPRQIPTADADASNEGASSLDELPPPGPDDFVINQDKVVTEIAGTYIEPAPPPVEVIKPLYEKDSNHLEIVKPGKESNAAEAVPVQPPTFATATVADTSTGGWQLPVGAIAVPGSGTDPDTGLPQRITFEKDPVEMVLIPPGVFLEGADDRDPTASPQHGVLLENPYYIDTVEVTVARYAAFREAMKRTEGRRMEPELNHDGNPEAPAVGIKFLDAKFYARWTLKELPTEAQWERAARGSQGYEYPWGNRRPIWHLDRHPGQLDSVGLHRGDISPHGVYDMAGNAREWCLDIYLPDMFQKDVAAGDNPVRNPTGPKGGASVPNCRS